MNKVIMKENKDTAMLGKYIDRILHDLNDIMHILIKIRRNKKWKRKILIGQTWDLVM